VNGQTGARRLAAAAAVLVDLVLPPRCPLCRRPTATQQALCVSCWGALPLIERPYCERLGIPFAFDHGTGMLSAEAVAAPPAYGRARAASRFEGSAVELVHRLKYGDRVDVAPLMGRLTAVAGRELLMEADLLVPIPLHRLRLWRRRYNQAALLAAVVSAASGVAHDPLALARTQRTRQQVGLSRSERLRNVQGAFTVPAPRRPALEGRRVVLVDDVVTTGATVDAAARTLLRAGAATVDVLSFARVTSPIGG
jgi:ComF family protein